MAEMRRFAATALFAVLVLPALLPFLALKAADPDFRLPSCCRRDGKHHCALGTVSTRDQAPETGFRGAPMACPYSPAKTTATPILAFYPPVAAGFYAAVVSHPAIHQQAEVSLRVAAARSHQKRGPPSSSQQV